MNVVYIISILLAIFIVLQTRAATPLKPGQDPSQLCEKATTPSINLLISDLELPQAIYLRLRMADIAYTVHLKDYTAAKLISDVGLTEQELNILESALEVRGIDYSYLYRRSPNYSRGIHYIENEYREDESPSHSDGPLRR